MRVLVLGASGSIGRYVAAEIARSPDVSKVVLAGRSVRSVGNISRMLGSSDRVEAGTVDVLDPGSEEAFAEVDVVVSAAGPAYLLEPAAVATAIRAGVDYVSLADDHAVTRAVMELDPQAKAAGVTVVSGCGLAPGLSNLLIDVAARRLDSVEEIDLSLARSSAESEGEATTMHFFNELTQPAPVISDFIRSEQRAGTAPRLVYFPEPVGWIETFRLGHPEIETLPERYGELRALQFRVGLTEKAAMDVARAAAASGVINTQGGKRVFVKASGPLRPFLERMPPRGPAWTALRVDVRGQSEGRTNVVSYGTADHLRNFAAVPIAQMALELGSGRAEAPGVKTVDEVVDSGAFLSGIARRGVRVARLEAAEV